MEALIRAAVLLTAAIFAADMAPGLSGFASAERAAPQVEENAPQASSMQVRGKGTLNWAGYVADSGTYTYVTGTWIVPEVSGAVQGGASAEWVGIGGARTKDLIQAGTEVLPTRSGGVAYLAWMETLPEPSRVVPFTVRPGDSVTVTVAYEGERQWLIFFRNNTTGETYEKRVEYDSSFSSAQWISELPAAAGADLVLSDFGSVSFRSGYAIKDGRPHTIADSGAHPVTMLNSFGESLAVPSALNDPGTGFTVYRTEAEALPLRPRSELLGAAAGP